MNKKQTISDRLDQFLRRHPRILDFLLLVTAVITTLVLLASDRPVAVLYQDF